MNKRETYRAAHPEFADFVDHVRAVFGGCKVRWVQLPDGTEFGTRGEPGVTPSIPFPRADPAPANGPQVMEDVMAMKGKGKGKGGGGKKC